MIRCKKLNNFPSNFIFMNKRILLAPFLMLLGVFTFIIGYNFTRFTGVHNVYKYTEIVATGYLSMIIGFVLITLGVYSFIVTSKHTGNLVGENAKKITLPRKRKKVPILIDIGLIFLFVGVALWALVCLGMIGRPEDLFTYSNMYANIGTLLFGFGVILSGIGIAIEIFLHLASKSKNSRQKKF
jgi:uncharacterized membrane protein